MKYRLDMDSLEFWPEGSAKASTRPFDLSISDGGSDPPSPRFPREYTPKEKSILEEMLPVDLCVLVVQDVTPGKVEHPFSAHNYSAETECFIGEVDWSGKTIGSKTIGVRIHRSQCQDRPRTTFDEFPISRVDAEGRKHFLRANENMNPGLKKLQPEDPESKVASHWPSLWPKGPQAPARVRLIKLCEMATFRRVIDAIHDPGNHAPVIWREYLSGGFLTANRYTQTLSQTRQPS
jgi:hypothetical protein